MHLNNDIVELKRKFLTLFQKFQTNKILLVVNILTFTILTFYGVIDIMFLMLNESIGIIVDKIKTILKGNPSICLFGSVVLNDFKLGWSDIDILVLTDAPIDETQVDQLVNLRQTLASQHNGNPYFRLFEGGILTKKAFFNSEKDRVVYWGTSGQRITERFNIDSFAVAELLSQGIILNGEDIRKNFTYPTSQQFKDDIIRHYNAIRKYAVNTDKNISSCGWLLDIARGLYTLKYNKVIPKTYAGEWAIEEKLIPDVGVMKRVIEIRKNPLSYINETQTLEWCGTLGKHIQDFADILEIELNKQTV